MRIRRETYKLIINPPEVEVFADPKDYNTISWTDAFKVKLPDIPYQIRSIKLGFTMTTNYGEWFKPVYQKLDDIVVGVDNHLIHLSTVDTSISGLFDSSAFYSDFLGRIAGFNFSGWEPFEHINKLNIPLRKVGEPLAGDFDEVLTYLVNEFELVIEYVLQW